jgi:hypothetical protein
MEHVFRKHAFRKHVFRKHVFRKHVMDAHRRPLLLPLILIASIPLSSPARTDSWATSIPPSARASQGKTAIIVARVRSLDLQTARIDFLTGCGHSLSLVRIEVTAETKIARGGAAIGLPDLAPGMVLRVEFARNGEGNRAAAVEVVEP